MRREEIQFEANVPQTVTLKYAAGKIVPGRFGDRVAWGLEGDQVMFLDLSVAEQINRLRPAAGDSIGICKLARQGQQTRWNVWYTPETELARAHRDQPGNELPEAEEETEVVRQMRGTIQNIREGKPPAAPRPVPVPPAITRRMNELPGASAVTPAPAAPRGNTATTEHHNTANRTTLVDDSNDLVDVLAAVMERSLKLYEGRIKPEEIRSCVLTVYIQHSKNAGGRHAAA